MTTVIVGNELRDKLKAVEHEAVICDENGSKVGWFFSDAEYMKMMYDRARQMFTDEELDRAEKEPGGRPLADIMADLRSKYGE
jgi:hypothetical protein